jgi:hypothetical protein
MLESIAKINRYYSKLARRNNCVLRASYLQEVNKIELECKTCSNHFSRSPHSLKHKIICISCRKDKKIAKIKFQEKAKNPNKGHYFEYLMAQALKECNHLVEEMDNLRVSEAQISPKDRRVIILLKKFINDKISSNQTFRALNTKENQKSISSDFLSSSIGISCKKETNAIKHPKFGVVWSFLQQQQIYNKILPSFTNINATRDQLLSQTNLDNENLFNLITNETFSLLENLEFKTDDVKNLYYFLLGKEKPFIVKLNDKIGNQYLEVFETSQIVCPNNLVVSKITSNQGRSHIQISFDNGVVVQQRIKSATNSFFSGKWWQLFKEEWTIVPNQVWLNTKKVYKL